MARYEASSVEFGERLKEERKREQQKIAKEQESFAKKIAGAQFAVKGINTYLDDRAEKFNASLADERAFLKTTQSNATTLLNSHKTNVLDKNITTRDYLDNINTEAFQTLVEKNVDGIIVQVPDSNGNIVERQAYDIPKSTFRNLKNFKVAGKEYADYDAYLDEQVANYDNALIHAKSVPSSAAEIETYLQNYSKEQLPTNIFSFVTRGARRFLKGENAESLKDKIDKSTQETLNDPRFSSFNNFTSAMRAYNNIFPNKLTDTLRDIAEGTAKDSNGNLIDVKKNKIIADVDVQFTTGTSTSIDAATNKKITTTVAVPVFKKTYVDGQVEANQGDSFEITKGEDLLVIFNAPVQNSINAGLTKIGQENWQKWVRDPENKTAENPFKSFSEFLATDEKNLFLKPDIDAADMLENFTEKIGVQVTEILLPPDKSIFTVNGEFDEAGYNAEVKRQQESNKELIESMFKTYMESINNVLKNYPGALGGAS